jgi:hypothetical protein
LSGPTAADDDVERRYAIAAEMFAQRIANRAEVVGFVVDYNLNSVGPRTATTNINDFRAVWV